MRGNVVALDLAAELSAIGFDAGFVMVYETATAPSLSVEALAASTPAQIDVVLLHSYAGAQHFWICTPQARSIPA